jgi:hypothetical protein
MAITMIASVCPLKMTLYLTHCCILFMINAAMMLGQTSSVPAVYEPQEHEVLQKIGSQYSGHTFGFGAGIIAGDASAGRETVLLSTLYSYRFSTNVGFECSLHYHSMDGAFFRSSLLNLTYAAVIWNGDVGIYTYPFASWQNFRIGAGISIRHHVSSNSSNLYIQNSNGATVMIRDIVYQKALSAGGSVKIDLIIASFQTMDLTLRGQGYIYALPISGDNYQTPFGVPGGAASLQVLVQAYF